MFTADGSWAVVQQGMNEATGMARQYHWLNAERFDADPHAAVAEARAGDVVNLVAGETEGNRVVSIALVRESPRGVRSEVDRLRSLSLPRRHEIRLADLDPGRLDRLERGLRCAYEAQPADYTDLLAVPGVGAKGLWALAGGRASLWRGHLGA